MLEEEFQLLSDQSEVTFVICQDLIAKAWAATDHCAETDSTGWSE